MNLYPLFRLLANVAVHDTATLAKTLEVSPQALRNGIDQLQSLGLDIDRETPHRVGLRTPIEPLDEARIRASCDSGLDRLDVLFVTDSTNTQLLTSRSRVAAVACTAEAQQRGRGRHGQEWISPLGSSVSVSVRRYWPLGLIPSGLSLAVGIAAIETLKTLTVAQVGLKWPNDLLVFGRKLGGILIESTHDRNRRLYLVIGIGINMLLPDAVITAINQPCIDIHTAAQCPVSRNELVGRLIAAILRVCTELQHHGFARYQDSFAAVDVLYAAKVKAHTPFGAISGIASGIDSDGALLVKTDTGCQRVIAGSVEVMAS